VEGQKASESHSFPAFESSNAIMPDTTEGLPHADSFKSNTAKNIAVSHDRQTSNRTPVIFKVELGHERKASLRLG
jgi:hypothetical protein